MIKYSILLRITCIFDCYTNQVVSNLKQGDTNKLSIEIMAVVVKNTVLVSVTLGSFVITEGFFVWCIVNFDELELRLIGEHLLATDSITNCVCLTLQFIFMEKYYYMLCNTCHKPCWTHCYPNESVANSSVQSDNHEMP